VKDASRQRLSTIAAQHASRAAPKPSLEEDERGPAFLSAFARARDKVLRPALAEVGLQLKEAGYLFRIDPGGDARSPSVDFRVILADRGGSKDTIRFVARKDAVQGWQVVCELELTGTPVELARFETAEEITHDVAEQLVLDGVEQMLAPAEALRSEAPSAPPPAAIPAPTPALPSVPASVETKPDEDSFLVPQEADLPSRPRIRAPAELSGTSLGAVAPTGPVVPFVPGVAASPPSPPEAAAGPPAPVPPRTRAPSELSGTSLAAAAPAGPAVPFVAPPPPSSPVAAPAPPAPVPPRTRAPAELAGTALAAVAPAGPAVPFVAGVASPPPSPAEPPAPVPKRTRAPAELGGTLDLGAPPEASHLPFAPAPEPPGPAGLSLEQYASLCVELAFEPAKAAETLLRYQIDAEQRKALDDHWQRRIKAEQSVRARFEQAYTAYQRWYATSRQR
jgi:hypothetical protein